MSATKASEWKRGYLIQFPSGRSAFIRPITVSMLVTVDLPNELMKIVEEWINGPRSGESISAEEVVEKAGGNMGAAKAGRQWYLAFAYASMVSPRMVDEPKDDEDQIGPLDMDDDDLKFLYEFLGRPAAELARFSEAQQAGSMESLYDVQRFFGAPQLPVGDKSDSK